MKLTFSIAARLWALLLLADPAWLVAQSPTPSSNYARGVEAFRHKDYTAAAALLADVGPDSADAALYRGKALANLKRFSEAESSLRLYCAAHPENPEARYLLGYVLFSQNQPQASLDAYTQAARLHRPLGDDLKIVGLDYVLLNDNEDAAKWLEQAVALDPADVDAWYALGRVRFSQNFFPKARAAFDHVLALDPRNVKAESNLGLLYEADSRPEDAIKAYRQAIAWQRANSSAEIRPTEQPFLNLGILLLARDQASEAEQTLQEAVRITPASASAHGHLGRAYLQREDAAKAQAELAIAVQLEPGNASWHYQLGRALRRLGQTERAKSEFVTAERILAGKSSR